MTKAFATPASREDLSSAACQKTVDNIPVPRGVSDKNAGTWLISKRNILMAAVASALLVSGVPSGRAQQCTVNWNDVRQKIDGFGASSAWRSSLTSPQYLLFFSTNRGIGLSLLRSHIYPDGSTTELSIMKSAQILGAKVWSSEWSPPTTYKDYPANGGNFVSSDANYRGYADQLARYVLNMKNNGVILEAISPQNEPDQDTTSYESCVWTAQQFHEFVPYLYAALVSNGVASTKIMLPEKSNWDFSLATPTMTDSNTASMVGVLAAHNYGSSPSAVNSYGKSLWETEVSTLGSPTITSNISNGLTWARQIHSFLTVANANAWHYWWLIPATTGNEGLTDVNGAPAKRLFTLGNYSLFVRPGYYRIGVVTNSGTALVSAYKGPSGSFALVAINSGSTSISETFSLNNFTTASVTPWVTSATANATNALAPVSVSGSSFTYTLPAMSVVTFTGQMTNVPPVLPPVADRIVDAGVALTVTNQAIDPDAPPQILTYSLLGSAPDHSVLNTNTGVFSWTPREDQAGTTNVITVQVTDNGAPAYAATNSFTVIVNPFTNTAPVLAPEGDLVVNAGVSVAVTNVAIDPDVPALETLTYDLLGTVPANATLNGASGVFAWRPTTAQAGTTNLITVRVADNGLPNLSATNSFTITVNPLTQPGLSSISGAGGNITLAVNGAAGPDYTVLTSTNLRDWQVLLVTNPPTTPFTLVDTNSTDATRFYRIQLGP